MTYKLITEAEYQILKSALDCECNTSNCWTCKGARTLRAVQEREGPKLRLTRHHQASMATIEELYSLPEEPK